MEIRKRREKINLRNVTRKLEYFSNHPIESIFNFTEIFKKRGKKERKRETTTRSINVSRYLKSNRIKFSSPTSQDIQLEDVKQQTEARQRETTKHEIAERETSLLRRRSPRWFSLSLFLFLFSLSENENWVAEPSCWFEGERYFIYIYVYICIHRFSLSLSFYFFLIFFFITNPCLPVSC